MSIVGSASHMGDYVGPIKLASTLVVSDYRRASFASLQFINKAVDTEEERDSRKRIGFNTVFIRSNSDGLGEIRVWDDAGLTTDDLPLFLELMDDLVQLEPPRTMWSVVMITHNHPGLPKSYSATVESDTTELPVYYPATNPPLWDRRAFMKIWRKLRKQVTDTISGYAPRRPWMNEAYHGDLLIILDDLGLRYDETSPDQKVIMPTVLPFQFSAWEAVFSELIRSQPVGSQWTVGYNRSKWPIGIPDRVLRVSNSDTPVSHIDPSVELGFCLIKPPSVERGHTGPIIDLLSKHGFSILTAKSVVLSEDQIETLYHEHRNNPYWKNIVSVMGLPVGCVAILVQSNYGNTIHRLRRLLGGSSNAAKCEDGSIRNKFGGFRFKADPSVYADNALHVSDSVKNVSREAALFFSDKEITEALSVIA